MTNTEGMKLVRKVIKQNNVTSDEIELHYEPFTRRDIQDNLNLIAATVEALRAKGFIAVDAPLTKTQMYALATGRPYDHDFNSQQLMHKLSLYET